MEPTLKADESLSMGWKQRLYDAYVSSGQATAGWGQDPSGTDPAKFFQRLAADVRRLIALYFPKERFSEILDVGCGHGPLLYFLTEAGYTRTSGVDASSEQVTLAERLGIRNIHCAPALEYTRSLPVASLDVVTLFDILEHLESQELFDLLDEVSRILRPGGLCLAHVPCAEGIFAMRVLYSDLTHVQAFTSVSAAQLFKLAGFSQVECFEERPAVYGVRSAVRRAVWDLGTIPVRLLFMAEAGFNPPILSQNMMIKARKPSSHV